MDSSIVKKACYFVRREEEKRMKEREQAVTNSQIWSEFVDSLFAELQGHRGLIVQKGTTSTMKVGNSSAVTSIMIGGITDPEGQSYKCTLHLVIELEHILNDTGSTVARYHFWDAADATERQHTSGVVSECISSSFSCERRGDEKHHPINYMEARDMLLNGIIEALELSRESGWLTNLPYGAEDHE